MVPMRCLAVAVLVACAAPSHAEERLADNLLERTPTASARTGTEAMTYQEGVAEFSRPTMLFTMPGAGMPVPGIPQGSLHARPSQPVLHQSQPGWGRAHGAVSTRISMAAKYPGTDIEINSEGGAEAARAAAKAAKQREKDISQALCRLLRHRAREAGVHIDTAGWVTVQDALAWMGGLEGGGAIGGPRVTEEEVRAVVAASDKQRFELRDDGAGPRIRASQGHSMPGIELDLEPLDAADVPVAVHGTYYAALEEIRRTGLSRMSRNHIHLAEDVPGASGVISGMRPSCEVLVWVDVRRCAAAGMAFHRSANGVILTEGSDGIIGPQFFDRIVDRKTGAAV